MLQALAPSYSVDFIDFGLDTPLTPAIVTALAGLGPKLTGLRLAHGPEHFSLERAPPPDLTAPPPQPGEVDEAATVLQSLLQTVAPRLNRLTLYPDVAGRYVPGASAVSCLAVCTALTSLRLQLPALPTDTSAAAGAAAELSALRVIASLSTLRSLELWGGGPWMPPLEQRPALAATLRDHLSRVTGLTSLCLRLRRLRHFNSCTDYDTTDTPGDEKLTELWDQLQDLQDTQQRPAEAAQLREAADAEWRALAAAARCMPGLVELRTTMQADIADLVALTRLTCCCVGALTRPLAATVKPAAAAAAGAAEPEPQRTYALPPALRIFETHAPLSVREVAALVPSPPPPGEAPCALLACGELWGWDDTPWCLRFDPWDFDQVERFTERFTEHAVAAFRRAVGVLQQLGVPEPAVFPRGVRIVAHTGNQSAQPPRLDRAPGRDRARTHVASWLGELASLRLDWLALCGLGMCPRDFLELARCFPDLVGLDLRDCWYSAAGLAGLAGMQRLESLHVDCRDFMEYDGSGYGFSGRAADAAVESAFLALTSAGPGGGAAAAAVPLPRLRRLEVAFNEDDREVWEPLLEAAKQELARRGSGAELLMQL